MDNLSMCYYYNREENQELNDGDKTLINSIVRSSQTNLTEL